MGGEGGSGGGEGAGYTVKLVGNACSKASLSASDSASPERVQRSSRAMAARSSFGLPLVVPT